jgi:5'-phosphate synthase pdxT subunit
MKIGVLALQGAFIEHVENLQKLGTEATEVRLPSHLEGLDGLIIPGGESTTILKLMRDFTLLEPLKKMATEGFPLWGTCAGMICLAKDISHSNGSKPMETLGLVDMTVRRNAFGRQVDSFEADLKIDALKDGSYHAVFIRAPIIESVSEPAEVLARLEDGTIVAARQGNILATSFHPELTEDTRFHRYFIEEFCGG